jgi:hypothetical protein
MLESDIDGVKEGIGQSELRGAPCLTVNVIVYRAME